jgi:hypothetical protein
MNLRLNGNLSSRHGRLHVRYPLGCRQLRPELAACSLRACASSEVSSHHLGCLPYAAAPLVIRASAPTMEPTRRSKRLQEKRERAAATQASADNPGSSAAPARKRCNSSHSNSRQGKRVKVQHTTEGMGLLDRLPIHLLEDLLEMCTPKQLAMLTSACTALRDSQLIDSTASRKLLEVPRAKNLPATARYSGREHDVWSVDKATCTDNQVCVLQAWRVLPLPAAVRQQPVSSSGAGGCRAYMHTASHAVCVTPTSNTSYSLSSGCCCPCRLLPWPLVPRTAACC